MTGWQPTCAAAALGGRNQAAQADGASRRSLASSRIFASWWRRRPASVFRKGNFTPISWAPCRRLGAARREGVPRSGAASARHRGVRGRHPDRVGEAPDPGSRSGVRAPRPCRWSSDRSGPATTRSVGVADPGRPRAAVVVTACTTPPHPHPSSQPRRACRVRAGLGIERAWWSRPEGSGEYALTPRGWLVRRPACRGRRTVRAAPWAVAPPRGRGWPSDRATRPPGTIPDGRTAVPSGSRVPQNDPGVPLAKVDTGHHRRAGGAWVVPRRRRLKEARP